APLDPEISNSTNNSPGSATVAACDVEGGLTNVGNPTTASAIVDMDPQFVRSPSPGADAAWGTLDDDYGDLHLGPTSPGIDSGINGYVRQDLADLDGHKRIAD